MTLKAPIGVDNFKKLIESDYTYVDKTLLIEDVIEEPAEVQLILRPRRFGKTLNMSMLAHFFDCQRDNRHLFKGLAIERRPCFEMCGKYPVLFLTFKNLNEPNYDQFVIRYRNMIAELFAQHEYLLDHLSPLRRETFLHYARGAKEEATLKDGLQWLTERLAEHYGHGVILLIDEYDSPIHEAHSKGYYNPIIDFMRGALTGALKTNHALKKAVLTGILRISKESIFSGLNHVQTYSVLSETFADKFGFTETETAMLLDSLERGRHLLAVQDWYNGYQVGDQIIYNPWSLLNYLNDPKGECKPHWLNTSNNNLVHELLLNAGNETQERLSLLMRGHSIEVRAEDHTSFRDLDGDALWTMLLYSGYLTCDTTFVRNEQLYQEVRIPNREVLGLFKKTFIKLFDNGMGREGMPSLLKALIKDDIQTFGIKLSDLVATVFSYYDTSGSTPERVYHAFVLGLLSYLQGSHDVRSNRESGLGRYDLMMVPKDKKGHGFVFEFKVAKNHDDLEQALQAGLDQIREQNYRLELEAQGIGCITEVAVAFHGKEVRVKKR